MPALRHSLRLLLLRAVASRLPRSLGRRWPPSRILALRPDHLGDLLFTVPALRLLSDLFPEAELDLAVGSWTQELAQAIPYRRKAVSFPFPGFERRPKGSFVGPYLAALRLARSIRGRYDAAVVFRPDHWWGAMVARLAGIETVLGWDHAEVRPFLTHSLPAGLYVHQVERALLLALLAAGRVPPLPSDREPDPAEPGVYCPCCGGPRPHRRPMPARLFRWQDHPLELDPDRLPGPSLQDLPVRRPFAVVHPGAGATIKHWSTEGFGRVCRTLKVEMGMDVAITGSASEVELARAVAEASGVEVAVLAGRTSLKELAQLMARASLAVGIDAGPMHMAVALGTPSLQLYGPTDPGLYGPWGNPRRHRFLRAPFPCHPCGQLDFARPDPEGGPCMLAIPVEDVVDEIAQLVGDRP